MSAENLSQDNSQLIYGLTGQRVEVKGETHFVADYMRNGLVARALSAGQYKEPDLHEFVAQFFRHFSGSMVHAGTFTGDMVPSFASHVPGILYGFEPVLESFVLAQMVVKANDLKNVFLLNAGLGAEQGLAEIVTGNHSRHFGGEASYVTKADDAVTQMTPVIRLDDLKLAQVDLIQLDIEGFEVEALKGGADTLERCQPAIVVEDKQKDCKRHLEAMGYTRIKKIEGNYLFFPPRMMDLASQFSN